MKGRQVAKAAYLLLAAILCGLLGLYLAGFLFHVSVRIDPVTHTRLGSWWAIWRDYRTDDTIHGQLVTSAAIGFGVAYGAPTVAIVATMSVRPKLYGDARFANAAEVQASGLLGGSGILVGRWGSRILQYPGTEHMLLIAPTRTGKGVSIVVPNCLSWPDSLVVLDVKSENFGLTSKYRARHGQAVYRFAPYDRQTHRHNPLGYLSADPDTRISEILTLAQAIYPKASDAGDIWQPTARNLFFGLALYLCETSSLPATIGEVLRQAAGKGQEPRDHLRDIIRARNFDAVTSLDEKGNEVTRYVPKRDAGNGPPLLSDACVDALTRFISAPGNTAGSIMTTFSAPLNEWANPIVDAATSACDFDLRQIRRQRMTVYVCIPVDKLEQADLLVRLFYAQLFNQNTDKLLHADPDLSYPVLTLNAAFAAIGYLSAFAKGIGYLAGYGFRMVTVVQSQGQLKSGAPSGYGIEGAKTLIDNHALRTLFAPKSDDANEYSELLGTYTFTGRSRDAQQFWKGTESDQRRPLMLPQELRAMKPNEQILSLEHTKPIKCRKLTYYTDPIFMDRLRSVSPALRAFGRRQPTKRQFENIAGSGELSSAVPVMDMDLHHAIVEQRTRTMTPEDIAGGVQIEHIAASVAEVFAPPIENTPEAVADVVGRFFAAFDTGNSDSASEQGADTGKPALPAPIIDLALLEPTKERDV